MEEFIPTIGILIKKITSWYISQECDSRLVHFCNAMKKC